MEKYGFDGGNMSNIDCQLQITMLSKLLREEILPNPAYCPENLLWLKDGNKSLDHFHQVKHRKNCKGCPPQSQVNEGKIECKWFKVSS